MIQEKDTFCGGKKGKRPLEQVLASTSNKKRVYVDCPIEEPDIVDGLESFVLNAPIEVLESVLGYLNALEILWCSRASSRVRMAITQTKNVLQRVELFYYWNASVVTDIVTLSTHSLQKFTLSGCYVDPSIFKALRDCKILRKLVIHRCRGFREQQEACLKYLSQFLREENILSELKLFGSVYLGPMRLLHSQQNLLTQCIRIASEKSILFDTGICSFSPCDRFGARCSACKLFFCCWCSFVWQCAGCSRIQCDICSEPFRCGNCDEELCIQCFAMMADTGIGICLACV